MLTKKREKTKQQREGRRRVPPEHPERCREASSKLRRGELASLGSLKIQEGNKHLVEKEKRKNFVQDSQRDYETRGVRN